MFFQKSNCRMTDRDRSLTSKRIKKIFEDLECDMKSNVQKMHVANSDKLVEFYSLNIIIAFEFKTNSKRTIKFLDNGLIELELIK